MARTSEVAMFLFSARIPAGDYRINEDSFLRVRNEPLRPRKVPEYLRRLLYGRGFDPFDLSAAVVVGPVQARRDDFAAETFFLGTSAEASYDLRFLAIARAEYPGIAWRALVLDHGTAAVGIASGEVVAVLMSMKREEPPPAREPGEDG